MRQRQAVMQDFSAWAWSERGLGPTTRRRYLNRALAAELWLVQERGVSIRWASPKDFQAYLFSTTPNARNRNNIRQALVAFCDFLVDRGYSETNNASALKRLPEPRLLPKALTTKQAARIAAASRTFGIQVELLIHLLLYTGMRKTEARLLERRHIVSDEYIQFVGKGNKERVVPIHSDVRPLLVRWMRDNQDPRWVFPSPRKAGHPISDTHFRIVVKEVGEAAGVLGLHPHALRHTFGTRLSEVGSKLEEIQELLGHADPKTTRLYVKVRPLRLKDAVEQLHYQGGTGADEAANPQPDPGPLLLEAEYSSLDGTQVQGGVAK